MDEGSDGEKGNICFQATKPGFPSEQEGKNKQC